MTRITIFLNQLKKLTYGKHIVARVEKLLVAGNAAAAVQQVTLPLPCPCLTLFDACICMHQTCAPALLSAVVTCMVLQYEGRWYTACFLRIT